MLLLLVMYFVKLLAETFIFSYFAFVLVAWVPCPFYDFFLWLP